MFLGAFKIWSPRCSGSIKLGSNLREKLNMLMEYGFVARRYNKSFKLWGVSAAYYLAPEGLSRLQLVYGGERVAEAINHSMVNYMEFFDDGGWDATGSNSLKLLIFTGKSSHRKSLATRCSCCAEPVLPGR